VLKRCTQKKIGSFFLPRDVYCFVLNFRFSPGADWGPVCNHMSRNLFDSWVDIPHVGQKGVIQDSVQDGRRTVTSNITPSASVLE